MAALRSYFRTGNYKYPFFISLGVILALVIWIASMAWSCHDFAQGVPPRASASNAASLTHLIDQKIVSVQAHSITASYQSITTFKEETSIFAIDANTKIYRQVPKDSAAFGQEMAEFQKKLIAAGRPITAALSYTLTPATIKDLVVGMRVVIEYELNAASSATSTQVAHSIQIEPAQSQ